MAEIKLACVFLAAGRSKRFGSDKLLYEIDGRPMAERAFMALPRNLFSSAFAVTRSADVARLAARHGIRPIINTDETGDTAVTIRLGVSALPDDTDACMFLVCDQPYLTQCSVKKLAQSAKSEPETIHALAYNGARGNPVVFPRALFPELLRLPPHKSGRYVIERSKGLFGLALIEADSPRELEDLDEPPPG